MDNRERKCTMNDIQKIIKEASKKKPTPIESKTVQAPVEDIAPIEQSQPKPRPTAPKYNYSAPASHPARFVMRDDVEPSIYAIKTPQSSYGIYNTDVDDFIKDFSKKNQRAGGCAITQSQLIEIVMDVMHYDIGLKPDGFGSHDELRQFIRSNLR